MKRLIIKRLCNDPDFEGYGQRYLDFLKRKAAEDPANYEQVSLVAPKLFEILQNTPPRYNL